MGATKYTATQRIFETPEGKFASVSSEGPKRLVAAEGREVSADTVKRLKLKFHKAVQGPRSDKAVAGPAKDKGEEASEPGGESDDTGDTGAEGADVAAGDGGDAADPPAETEEPAGE